MGKQRQKFSFKRAGSLVVNVLTVAIVLFSVILAVSSIVSKGKGYVNILGYSYLSVATESMKGGNEDSFDEGDIIRVKILNNKQKTECEEGQIITFWDEHISYNKRLLNSHRVVEVVRNGDKVSYRTKGDNNNDPDQYLRPSEDVVGVYKGKANGIGSAMLWMQTKTGFLVCVVVPSGIVLVYAIIMMVINAVHVSANKALSGDAKAKLEAELREKILKEMQEKSPNGDKER